MNTYRVRLSREKEGQVAYEICGISAETHDEAAEYAKKAIAENGYWPILMSIEARMALLSVVETVIDR